MVSLTLRGRKEEKVFKAGNELKASLEKESKSKNIEILGPAPSPISKMKLMHRWNIFLRSESAENITSILRKTLNKNKSSGIIITVDVDPN